MLPRRGSQDGGVAMIPRLHLPRLHPLPENRLRCRIRWRGIVRLALFSRFEHSHAECEVLWSIRRLVVQQSSEGAVRMRPLLPLPVRSCGGGGWRGSTRRCRCAETERREAPMPTTSADGATLAACYAECSGCTPHTRRCSHIEEKGHCSSTRLTHCPWMRARVEMTGAGDCRVSLLRSRAASLSFSPRPSRSWCRWGSPAREEEGWGGRRAEAATAPSEAVRRLPRPSPALLLQNKAQLRSSAFLPPSLPTASPAVSIACRRRPG